MAEVCNCFASVQSCAASSQTASACAHAFAHAEPAPGAQVRVGLSGGSSTVHTGSHVCEGSGFGVGSDMAARRATTSAWSLSICVFGSSVSGGGGPLAVGTGSIIFCCGIMFPDEHATSAMNTASFTTE